MFKTAYFLKSKRALSLMIAGVLCLATLVGVSLSNALAKQNFFEKETKEDYGLRLLVYPGKYTMSMSSTPGICILAQYQGKGDQVQYSATHGQLLTWDNDTGIIKKWGENVVLPFDGLDRPVYWTPSLEEDNLLKDTDQISVKTSILNSNVRIAEKQVNIRIDGTMFFIVEASPDVVIHATNQLPFQYAKTIDQAVSYAVKEGGKNYYAGEVVTEGHIILETEEKDGIVTAYTLASLGWFGFENGIFTVVSGSGAIPTVMTFSKNDMGEYTLLEYEEPMDGAGYTKSIKKLFPKRLWDQVLGTDRYPDLVKQQEEQAKQYLQSIDRDAEVNAAHVEKELVKIDVGASNKIFAEYTKYDPVLNNFPYWLGTKELLENGERYIYQTSQSKTSDGYDLISFIKTKEDGTEVKAYYYKVVGNEPQLIS